MTPAAYSDTDWLLGINVTSARLQVEANADEPQARAEGRIIPTALHYQRLSCGSEAEKMLLRHVENLPAFRACAWGRQGNVPDITAPLLAAFERDSVATLDRLRRASRQIAAIFRDNGIATTNEAMERAAIDGFRDHLRLLMDLTHEGGRA